MAAEKTWILIIKNLMNKSVEHIFLNIYYFYKNWGDKDAYYHTAFIIGAFLASVINILIALVYKASRYELFEFHPLRTGILLLLIVSVVIYYFHRKKKDILTEARDVKKLGLFNNIVIVGFFILTLGIWITAAYIYKQTYIG